MWQPEGTDTADDDDWKRLAPTQPKKLAKPRAKDPFTRAASASNSTSQPAAMPAEKKQSYLAKYWGPEAR